MLWPTAQRLNFSGTSAISIVQPAISVMACIKLTDHLDQGAHDFPYEPSVYLALPCFFHVL